MADTLSDLVAASRGGDIRSQIANPTLVNPLAAYNSALGMAEKTYQLRGVQANEALGQAYQQAIDPATGRLDPLKFNQFAARLPNAALAMRENMVTSQALQGSQLEQNMKMNGVLNSSLAGVLKLPDDQLHDGVVKQAQWLISQGFPADRVFSGVLSLQGQNPQQLRTQLETMWRGTMSPEQQREATYGRIGSQTGPGGNTIGTVQQTTGPNAGAVSAPPQQGAPQGLPATQLDAPFTYKDDKGAEQTTTLRQFMIDHGYTFPAQGGPGGAPGGLPSSLRGPGAASPASPTSPAPGPKPVQTAPAPADIKQQEAEAERSVNAFRDISSQGVAARSRVGILGNMLGDTTQFTTGPLAGIVGKVRSYANNIGLNINTEAQTAKESFAKFAAGLALAQQGGTGSDSRMNVSMAANPHEELSPAGVDLMIRQLQGNEDYLLARSSLASKYPDQKNINKFESDVASKLDPRAFQFARMQPGQQRQTYFKGLSDKDQKAVRSAYNWAVENGIISGE